MHISCEWQTYREMYKDINQQEHAIHSTVNHGTYYKCSVFNDSSFISIIYSETIIEYLGSRATVNHHRLLRGL